MILIGLGSNLSGGQLESPRAVLESALSKITENGISIEKLSRFYESEPVPKSDQPWFVNAVASVKTSLSPQNLLKKLHEIEAELGRERRIRWEARIIDLDILVYQDQILPSIEGWYDLSKDVNPDDIIIPHPRMQERLFVLRPLMDIDPDWRHPILNRTAREFADDIEKIAEQGIIRPIS